MWHSAAIALVMSLWLAAAPAASAQPTSDALHAYVSRLPVGSTVKVTLKQGKSFKGILMVVEPDAIVVKPKTRIPTPERRLTFNEVDFVELEKNGPSHTLKSVGIGVATGVGVFFALLLMFVVAAND